MSRSILPTGIVLIALAGGCFEDTSLPNAGTTDTEMGTDSGPAGVETGTSAGNGSGTTADTDQGGSNTETGDGTETGDSAETSDTTTGEVEGTCAEDWAYRWTVRVDNPGDALPDHRIALALPSTFDYGHTFEGGADLRLSASEDPCDPLPYWIESFEEGGTSMLWIRVDVPAASTRELALFYGNPDAVSQSDFEAVFPNAFISKGDMLLGGAYQHDWFEVADDHVLSVASMTPTSIRAYAIRIHGRVTAYGAGHPGGEEGRGEGPGGGVALSAFDFLDSAGGGYGGEGGQVGLAEQGGSSNTYGDGSPGELGSGGGAFYYFNGEYLGTGGAGGGSLHLVGDHVRIGTTGEVAARGQTPIDPHSGGGSGGNLVVEGRMLEHRGVLSVRGGHGGEQVYGDRHPGGGGGGGRMRLRYTDGFTDPGELIAVGGNAGDNASSGHGAPGVIDVAATNGLSVTMAADPR